MLNRRTLSHAPRGLPHVHRLAPHIVDCEPITWFGDRQPGRRLRTRGGFVIGLIGGGGVGLLVQALARSF